MLNRLFAARGIAMQELAGGAAVPLRFTDSRAEHRATRRAAGLFDFSFMAMCEVSGPRARQHLERLQTRSLAPLLPGRILYTLLLRDDGSVFNDATVWCHAPDRYWLFTGRRGDCAWLEESMAKQRPPQQARLDCLDGRHSILAVQGPRSLDALGRVIDLPPGGLPYFAFAQSEIDGESVWVGRLGYSGELGFEVVVPAGLGSDLWRRLTEAGAEAGLQECGFEAANSLRIESGLILFSGELRDPVDPFELGYARLLTGIGYVGAAALRGRRCLAPRRRLGGIITAEGGRAAVGDHALARVTSEAYAPMFERTLALGFIEGEGRAPGSLLRLADGRLAMSARLPFYDPMRVLPRGGQPAARNPTMTNSNMLAAMKP